METGSLSCSLMSTRLTGITMCLNEVLKEETIESLGYTLLWSMEDLMERFERLRDTMES